MRQAAFQSVQRACLFGALAVFCMMVGLSFEPRLAFKAGGTATMLMAIVLPTRRTRRAANLTARPRCG